MTAINPADLELRATLAGPNGASAIGVVDSGGLFTGTTVEAALAEAGGRVRIGSGSPLGVVTPAYVGQLYSDTAQTNGARLWVATTTASSGWLVAVGDTGWRDMRSSLVAGASATTFAIRRTNDIVHFEIAGLLVPAVGQVFLTLPAGFQVNRTDFIARDDAATGNNGTIRAYLDVRLMTYPTTLGSSARFTSGAAATSRTNWPTTLPGTAV